MKMRMGKNVVCSLVVLACSTCGLAQTVVSRRTEVREVMVQAIGAQPTNEAVRDVPFTGVGGIGISASPSSGMNGVSSPAVTRTSVEMEITELAFQIPNFDPADQLVYQYHVGTFSANGNGNGSAFPDETGYVLFEMSRHAGDMPQQAYLYGVNVDTGKVQVFIDIDNVNVNKAVEILNNVSRAGASRSGIIPREMMGRYIQYYPFPEVGNRRSTGLHGNYLDVDDLRQQIRDQARCRVEQDDVGVYYLDYCD